MIMLTEKQTPAIIDLPKYLDNRGNLSYIEEDTHLSFRIRRVYWIYDVPGGESRGGHAFKSTEELIVALSGSFDVVLNDGEKEYRFSLNRSYYGLYVPSMMWRLIENFSTNSLALVIASTDYSINEYIRDFNEFCRIKKNEKVGI
jgi:oxalate decarboxylase/phosphoglucose isomerase-like protein (cupin superfamily)